jgi:hypothetical protein
MRWCIIAFVLMVFPLIALPQAPRLKSWGILPLAHSDAKLILGLDWRRLVESPLGPAVLKQVSLGGHPLLLFLDSIENVERILFSSPGKRSGGRPPMLVAGQGRFQMAKIRALAKADGAVSRRYNDVELLAAPNASNQDLHFAFLEDQIILAGDGASVKSAIDRWQRKDTSHQKNPVHIRALGMSSAHEVWAVADTPSESLASLNLGESELAEQVERLEIGLTVTQTLNAHLLIHTASEEAADTLGAGLPALLQLAAFAYQQQPSLAHLARKVKVMREKNLLKIGFNVDAALFEQSMNELRAAAAPAATVSQPAAPALAAPSVAASSERKVVRIVGMDDGVKEIPFESKPPL